jgi:hypothetical protein
MSGLLILLPAFTLELPIKQPFLFDQKFTDRIFRLPENPYMLTHGGLAKVRHALTS